MPTSVADVLDAAQLGRDGVVAWGTKPDTAASGVYVVSLTRSLSTVDATIPTAPLSSPAFEKWLKKCPELTMDGHRPTGGELMDRIGSFWVGDEAIVYIGLATSLSTRLVQYYQTPIGARRPHSGGYFLKLLGNLDELWVHYAVCSDPARAEFAMLGRFCEGVSEGSKRRLADPAHPFPFANLEWPRGVRKAHGLRRARESRVSRSLRLAADSVTRVAKATPDVGGRSGEYRTQRVTATDRGAGQIRIPSASTVKTKSLFPASKATLSVVLRGQRLRCSWDPRTGRDRQRSGVLRVGAVLRDFVTDNETLGATAGADGTVYLD